MPRSSVIGLSLVLAFAAGAFAQNAKEILQSDPAKLVEIIQQADAPTFEKAKACQRLAVVGNKDAVPALAALLSDETLNLYARTGLEGIADPAVDDALRTAVGKLQGRQLVGVIESIGRRKDAAALRPLARLLASDNEQVAAAAAKALGRIGSSESAGILKDQLAKSKHKIALADACLTCAQGLAAAKPREAFGLYAAIADADVPKHLKIAALVGRFHVQGGGAKDLLLEQLRSADEDFFNLGLAEARRVPGADVTTALAGELTKLPPPRQALLLLALGDRKEAAPLAVALAASKSEHAEVREAAIRVLARVGDASVAAILLDAALGEGPAARTAQDRLRELSGKEIDAAIVARLAGASGPGKAVLLELVAARRIAAAADAVNAALADADANVRTAAIGALGQLIELKDLQLLVGRALAGSNPAETAAAQTALKRAALRMADREACAAALAENLKGGSAESQVNLLELLGKLGGQKALATVVAQTRSGDAALKDASTRVLGAWVNADAAPALLEIAKADDDGKYRIRALRGYLRIARQLQLPPDTRLAMFKTAMETAQRDEEKQLALDVLTRIPSVATLELAAAHLAQPALKESAATAAVKIAPKVVASDAKAVAGAMQRVVDSGAAANTVKKAQQLLTQARGAAK